MTEIKTAKDTDSINKVLQKVGADPQGIEAESKSIWEKMKGAAGAVADVVTDKRVVGTVMLGHSLYQLMQGLPAESLDQISASIGQLFTKNVMHDTRMSVHAANIGAAIMNGLANTTVNFGSVASFVGALTQISDNPKLRALGITNAFGVAMGPASNAALGKIGDITHALYSKSGLSSAINSIGTAINTMNTSFGNYMNNTGETSFKIAQNVANDTIQGLKAANMPESMAKTVGNKLANMVNATCDIYQWNVDMASTVYNSAGDYTSALTQKIPEISKNLSSVAVDVYNGSTANTTLPPLFENGQPTDSYFTKVMESFGSLLSGIGSGAGAAAGAAKDYVTAIDPVPTQVRELAEWWSGLTPEKVGTSIVKGAMSGSAYALDVTSQAAWDFTKEAVPAVGRVAANAVMERALEVGYMQAGLEATAAAGTLVGAGFAARWGWGQSQRITAILSFLTLWGIGREVQKTNKILLERNNRLALPTEPHNKEEYKPKYPELPTGQEGFQETLAQFNEEMKKLKEKYSNLDEQYKYIKNPGKLT